MKITIQIIAILIWGLIVGIWLDQTLPDYGKALGVGIGGAVWLGFWVGKTYEI